MHSLTLGDVAHEHARTYADETAAVCYGARVTYRELDERVNRLASQLAAHGITCGDRVLWLGQNCHRVLELLLAAGRLGAMVCPVNWRQSGYHLWEDTVVAEDLVPGGSDPVAEQEVGELVVTDIDNLVAPLVRYRAEDLVRVDRNTCGCGRTHARMWPLGRAGDLTIVAGRSVMPMEVWAVIERYDETRSALFQIVRPQREVDKLRIRVGYAPERTRDLDDLRQRLAAGIEAAVGVTPELELVDEQQIIARTSSVAKIPRIAKE